MVFSLYPREHQTISFIIGKNSACIFISGKWSDMDLVLLYKTNKLPHLLLNFLWTYPKGVKSDRLHQIVNEEDPV